MPHLRYKGLNLPPDNTRNEGMTVEPRVLSGALLNPRNELAVNVIADKRSET